METGEVKHFRHQANDPESLLSDYIYAVYPDKKGLAWISTARGLDCLNPQKTGFTHYISKAADLSTPGAGFVNGFYETTGGDIWFGNYEFGTYEQSGMSFYQQFHSFTRYHWM
jgi:hypothetical protein